MTIRTEQQGRVPHLLVEREHRQWKDEIRGKIMERMARLKAQHPEIGTEWEFIDLCTNDEAMRELEAELIICDAWRRARYEFGCIPTIEAGGTIRWRLPEDVR